MATSFRKWVAANLRDGDRLSEAVISVVSDFTLAWGLFEGTECESSGSMHQFDRFSRRVADSISVETAVEHLEFWKHRYVENGALNHRFDSLYFRDISQREVVSSVLLGETNDVYKLVLALVLIVFRLRNNLFHGLKVITRLDDQVENLERATAAIQWLMPHSKRYIYLDAA